MESERLYQVQKEDLPKLENLLTQCFREDPLYHSLIPNKDVRERLMPELFKCDLTEFYECCDIYADSPECNSLLVVSDEMEPYEHLFKAYFTEIAAALKTDGYLLKEDASMHTFWNFNFSQLSATFCLSGLTRSIKRKALASEYAKRSALPLNLWLAHSSLVATYRQ